VQLRGNRKTERAAVNATRTFFEANNVVFQEIDADNDYGKDAYVDLTEGTLVTGFVVALQIKGGVSYKRGDRYGIPLDPNHESLWRGSTTPVGGVVFDPDDGLLRWCNISQHLDEHPKDAGSYIPVPREQVLTADSLQSTFRESFKHCWERQAGGGRAVLRLCSRHEDEQVGALFDCLAFGRRDARVLIALRYMLRVCHRDVMHDAIHILSHITPHPDILWHKGNWIPDEVCREVSPHFSWTIEEILFLLASVPWEEWQRGAIGESLYMLFFEDPEIQTKMEQAAFLALDSCSDEVAFAAMYLTLYWSSDPRGKHRELIEQDNRFGQLELAAELAYILEESPSVPLF
jgi:hypothetical protein